MAQALVSCGPSLFADLRPGSCLRHCDRPTHSGDSKPYPGHPLAGTSWGHVMQLDPQLTPQQPPDADSIWEMFKSALPVVFVSMCAATLYHIQDALKERTWRARLAVILVSASTGAVIGPIGVSFAHEYFPSYSHMSHLAFGCFLGAACPQALRIALCKLFGISHTNLNDPNDIDDCKQLMTPEERARHADTCPFEPDRYEGRCMQCPHRKQHEE